MLHDRSSDQFIDFRTMENQKITHQNQEKRLKGGYEHNW